MSASSKALMCLQFTVSKPSENKLSSSCRASSALAFPVLLPQARRLVAVRSSKDLACLGYTDGLMETRFRFSLVVCILLRS